MGCNAVARRPTFMKIKIIGAGSIGNHMANGCRSHGWDVAICDLDSSALQRTRHEIYPSRYGFWDPAIRLGTPDNFAGEAFDAVIVGTPPDTHVKIAASELGSAQPPKALMIEKPLCTPSLEECERLRKRAAASGTRVLVGYNHRLTPHSVKAAELLASLPFGAPQLLHAGFEEHWGGIFTAHPWLNGPQDTYLGFTARGGGAGGEHSHGINIWQHFARLVGAGRVVEVHADVEMVERDGAAYDRSFQALVRTESGLRGSIRQDVVTAPPRKWCRLQCERGHIAWDVNSKLGEDAVSWQVGEAQPETAAFSKTRPDDFKGELAHLAEVVSNPAIDSPISLERGLETMLVLIAAHRSSERGAAVTIDYSVSNLADALS